MAIMKRLGATFFFLAASLTVTTAQADVVDVMVGDADGFGFGLGTCPDVGSCASLSTPPIDNRSAAEAAAVNGAQFTDVYSSLFSGQGPNGSNTGDVVIPFTGTLIDGTLNVAAGDFQSDVFGALAANINGDPVSFDFPDGRFVTAIHSFTLTATELAAANLAGEVDLHLDRNGSGDFIAFDYFELTGDTAATTPEPSSLVLFAGGLLAFGCFARRRYSN
jgi:hypothetical protein